MTIYEEMTRRALTLLRSGHSPREAWETAAQQQNDASESTRNKGCPRAAFVGLAEGGHIKGVDRSSAVGTLSKNAEYVLRGAEILKADPELRQSKTELWIAIRHALSTERENQGGVLDVLFALTDENALQA